MIGYIDFLKKLLLFDKLESANTKTSGLFALHVILTYVVLYLLKYLLLSCVPMLAISLCFTIWIYNLNEYMITAITTVLFMAFFSIAGKLYIDYSVHERTQTLITKHNIKLTEQYGQSQYEQIQELKKSNKKFQDAIESLQKNVRKLEKEIIENERLCDEKFTKSKVDTLKELQKVTNSLNSLLLNIQRK